MRQSRQKSNSELYIIACLLMGLVENFIHFAFALRDSCVRDGTHSFPETLRSTQTQPDGSMRWKEVWSRTQMGENTQTPRRQGDGNLFAACHPRAQRRLVAGGCERWNVDEIVLMTQISLKGSNIFHLLLIRSSALADWLSRRSCFTRPRTTAAFQPSHFPVPLDFGRCQGWGGNH